MKVLVAPDKFKGTLSALGVAEALAEGLRSADPGLDISICPAADGGEGTMQAMVDALGGRLVARQVSGPLGDPVEARFGIVKDTTAIIEMAQASGLALLPPAALDPMRASTRGTGQLINAALDEGCRRLIVGIGGSATVDGGAGMAQSLGARLLDATGTQIAPGGGGLCALERIDASDMCPRPDDATVLVASDVVSPLLGPAGAARVFGPQKGATPEQVEQLERCLSRYADVLERDLGVDLRDEPGAGAAGGLGAGLMAFLHASIRPGVEVVLEALDFEKRLAGVDLVVTGEGRIDGQTAAGKTPVGVARAAKKRGIEVIAVAGQRGEGAEKVLSEGIDEIMTVVPDLCSLEQSTSHAAGCLSKAGKEIGIRLRSS